MVLSLIFYSIFTTHIDILDKINLFNNENKNNLNSEGRKKKEEEESYLNMKKNLQISRPFSIILNFLLSFEI